MLLQRTTRICFGTIGNAFWFVAWGARNPSLRRGGGGMLANPQLAVRAAAHCNRTQLSQPPI
jgi:hypothetical protein